jgi:subtilisin family serine protease
MHQLIKITFLILFTLSLSISSGQDVNKKILNWYNGKKYGMHTDAAYKKLLSEKTSEPVIVAVIDSGVDIEHEDLQGRIWINEDEIAGNGIDDDNNGYIDDVHGWNFLGNPSGENLNDVQLEITRIYQELDVKFANKSSNDIKQNDLKDYLLYKEVKKEVDEIVKENKKALDNMTESFEILETAHNQLNDYFKGDYSYKDLKKGAKNEDIAVSSSIILQLAGFGLTFDDFISEKKYLEHELGYTYNINVFPREVVGDNPYDFEDKDYGNNDVEGPDAGHGTHCSGIITAVRGNDIGNDGVADNARIMSLRAVPDGDEQDKDIALAVRYAVDNGAKVISMSFGKAYSPQQEEVIAAFRYAEEKGVLLIHAAGNEGRDVDEGDNYPCAQYESMSDKFSNWIEVGASTRWKKAKFKGEYMWRDGLAAEFSNYGDKMVDVYAPGADIYSTVPQSEYDIYDGTSMACPMVAGLAALLKSYYPTLTMFQIRDIILESVQNVSEHETPLPGDSETTATFVDLCVTGGIVNTYNAVLKAEELTK